jgi:uncharacterized protein involved in exopolysaccharide biosynthesis
MVAQSDIAFDRSPPALDRDAGQLGLGDLLRIVVRRRGLMLRSTLVAVVLAAGFLAVQTPVYRPVVEVLVDPQGLQVVGKDIVASGSSASLDFANIDSQPFVILSPAVMEQVVRDLELDKNPRFVQPGLLRRLLGAGGGGSPTVQQAADLLRDRVQVKRVEPSFVFQITVTHPDAKLAADIANTIAKVYLALSSEQRSDTATRTGATLAKQAEDMRTQLDRAETAVEKFKADNGLISTGESGLIQNQQLRDVYAQISTATGDVARLQARADQLKKIGRGDVDPGSIPEAALSASVIQLRAQYARIVQEEARLGETLGSNHPQIAQLRSQRETTLRLIADEVARTDRTLKVDLDRAKANLTYLEKKARELTQTTVSNNEAQVKLRQLEAEAEAIRSVYTAFLGRAKELEQQRKVQASNSRIITMATPPDRSSAPPAGIVLIAGGFFGAMVGLGIGVALDLVSGVLTRPAHAALILGTRLLAVLPKPGARRRWRILGRHDAEEVDRIAAIPFAQTLRDRFRTLLPATVMIVDASASGASSRMVTGAAAGTLVDLGEAVVLCTIEKPGRAAGSWRRRLAGLGPESDRGPLMDVRRIDPDGDPSRRRRRRLTLMDAAEEIVDEFILFDAGPATADPGLATLFDCVDAIVVVAEEGRTTQKELGRVADLLEPWRRRVAGVVVIGSAS